MMGFIIISFKILYLSFSAVYHLSIRLITFAGTPPTTVRSGTSFVTTAFAATTLPLPILTPGKMNVFDPIHTLSSMIISPTFAPLLSSDHVASSGSWVMA